MATLLDKEFDFLRNTNDTFVHNYGHFESVEKLFEKILKSIKPADPVLGIPVLDEFTESVGSFNQILIYASGFFGQKYQAFVIFDDNKKAKSFVLLQTIPEVIDGVKRTKVVRSWTREDSRGQGLATTIYQFLVKKLNLELICDTSLTQDSIRVYKGFIDKKVFDKITFYNSETKKIQSEIPADIWTVDNDWRILLDERTYNNSNLYGMPVYRHLPEYIYHMNEGLE